MRIMTTGSDLAGADDRARVRAYHDLSTHRLDRFAPGPETLDWDSQPDPFRNFAGARRTPLPLSADGLTTGFADLSRPGAVAPAPLSLDSLALLLELSLGVSAWKAQGPDRWALRCNPSSGNLHPTEAYVIAGGVPGLADGVHHYDSHSHGLEQRCAAGLAQPGMWIGLGSVHWREAWKYGTRGFRYCQLDTGHALGALRCATARPRLAGAQRWSRDLTMPPWASCWAPTAQPILPASRRRTPKPCWSCHRAAPCRTAAGFRFCISGSGPERQAFWTHTRS
ncbi:MAG: SagB/ThcOx family dehydrogenase, partial [Mangrovicoccus sp.]|nr:SagB/ThcOx family dehydrogenase [Mangrovicoccus sp.]